VTSANHSMRTPLRSAIPRWRRASPSSTSRCIQLRKARALISAKP
jgi:hypothetical protein